MKKIALLAGTCALFILAACGGDSSTSASKNDPSDPAEATVPKETDQKDSGSTEMDAAEDVDIISNGDSINTIHGEDSGNDKSSSSVKNGSTGKSSSSVKAGNSSSSVKAESSSSEKPNETTSSSQEETFVPSSSQFNPCSEAPTFKENWKYLNPDIQYGCFMDSRDKQYYVTVKIGDHTWMAENLGYSSCLAYSTKDSWCGYSSQGFQERNQGGYLYSWDIAMADTNCTTGSLCKPRGQVRGICPEGFHLPSYWEWQDLFHAVGGDSIAARELKSAEVWEGTGKGTNKYGFSVIPNAARYGTAGFSQVNNAAVFWTSIELGPLSILSTGFTSRNEINSWMFENKEFSFSIRCLMDYPEQETSLSGIPHDPDKIYQCDEMLIDDINTWHFIDRPQRELQYFIDDRDSISIHFIRNDYIESTTKTDYANDEEGLYYMFWSALLECEM